MWLTNVSVIWLLRQKLDTDLTYIWTRVCIFWHGVFKPNNWFVLPAAFYSVSRAWCRTIVTPSHLWRSYNSFAPSHRFCLPLVKLEKKLSGLQISMHKWYIFDRIALFLNQNPIEWPLIRIVFSRQFLMRGPMIRVWWRNRDIRFIDAISSCNPVVFVCFTTTLAERLTPATSGVDLL